MNRIAAALGIDFVQWKALTVAALKLDFRTASWGASREQRTARGVRMLLGQVLFYTMIGVVMALAVAWIGDPFVAGLAIVTYVLFMVGTAMLVDHNTTVVSPADYGILGFQPITSRTYFAARLTNVLVYTLAMTTALGWIPLVVFLVRHGILIGSAAALALYLCAITVTLAVVAGYLSLVQRVGARRLRGIVSWLQLLLGIVIYGGYFLVVEFMSRAALASLTITKSPAVLLYPGTWFASWIELAAGRFGTSEVVPALVSVALLALLAWRLRGRLSLEYAEQLAAVTTATAPPPGRTAALKPGRWFRGGEARAIALLVRGQFRSDLKFRMGVLGILPLTLLYLFMGLRNRNGGDSGPGAQDLSMVTLAVLLFPAMLKMHLGRSDAFRASWIFFASPTDRMRLIRSSNHVLVAFFLIPYLFFVGATLAWVTDSFAYLAVYLGFTGCVSYLVLLLMTFFSPELPFSKPAGKGQSTKRFFGALIVISLIGALLPTLARLLYRDAIAATLAFAALAGLGLLLDRLTRFRIERQSARLEFQG